MTRQKQTFERMRRLPVTAVLVGSLVALTHAQLPQGSREGQASARVAQADLGPRVDTEDDTRRGRHRR